MSKQIHCIGICGIGQMGAAAAVSFKRAGYDVIIWGRSSEKLTKLPEKLEQLEAWMEEHVGPAPQDSGRYRLSDLGTVDAEANLVMDCIAEDMGQKVALFQSLQNAINRKSVFITVTSGLSITEMGRKSGTSQLLAGTHFWNPPHLMPLVEVVRGQDTPSGIIDQVVAVVKSIGKIPVRVNRDVPGFIGNRLLHSMWCEAIYLIQEGIASPEDVDLVARLTFGLRLPVLGPVENMDLVGLDLVKQIHEYLLEDLSGAKGPLPKLVSKVKAKQLGMKSGVGFYDWEKRNQQTLIDRRDKQIIHQLDYLKKLGAM